MKILEIALMPPGKKSGGELGIYQSICSLSAIGTVDYIGPDFKRKLFSNNVRKLFILTPDNEPLKCERIWRYLLKKASTSFYSSWAKIENSIDWKSYDFVHIEFSRYEFIVKQAQKNEKKVLVRVHNIESDYGYNIFRLTHKLGDYLRYHSFKTNEKKVMKDADGLVFLTRRDIDRAIKKYGIEKSKAFLNPVCMEEQIVDLKKNKGGEDTIHILITGSFSYEPNEKGIIWFLEHVWKELENGKNQKKYQLTLAGGNAKDRMIDFIHIFKNIDFVNTPESMHPYFENADIYVASVFSGAGMKVKVAESLSYGLPVIGTDCALEGYEMDSKSIMAANNKEEFISALLKVDKISDKRREVVRNYFKKKYSMESSIGRYQKIINKFMEAEDGYN